MLEGENTMTDELEMCANGSIGGYSWQLAASIVWEVPCTLACANLGLYLVP